MDIEHSLITQFSGNMTDFLKLQNKSLQNQTPLI